MTSDTKLEQRIQNALERDPFVERYEIIVDAINGTAYLYGTVDTFYEKFKAEDIASRIKGVVTVKNKLKVDEDHEPYTYSPYLDDVYPGDYGWYRYEPHYSFKSDAEIKDDIEDELWWSPFVDSDDVNVTVKNGIATLTGTVDSWSEYNTSAKNAYEGGAALVRNELVVLESK
jgi:osmotically-inducible protein OsmY